MSTEPTTIAERYTSAINTTDLRMAEEREGSAELLAAFGLSASLGALLLRLQGEYDQVAQDVAKVAEDDKTAAILIFMHMKSLGEAKEALAQHALQMATRRKHMLTDKEVLVLTGHTLVAWLDVRCRSCHGAKILGQYQGKRPMLCRACGGTGMSAMTLGHNDVQKRFCADLLQDMNAKSGPAVARDVASNKRAVRAGKARIASDLARST